MIAIAVICRYLHRPRWAKVWFYASCFWLFLIAMSPIPIWLAYQLEYRYPVLNPSQIDQDSFPEVNIVVLGGGMTTGANITAADQLSPDALSRVVEGIRIYHQISAGHLITSGYSLQGKRSQADFLASTAVDLGVQPSDTFLLSMPRTTREEALAYKNRFDHQLPIILVTSALHLPRAMGWFKYQGLNPIPAPANHMIKIDPDKWTYHWRPSMRKISIMQKVFHEYTGHAELAWVSRSE